MSRQHASALGLLLLLQTAVSGCDAPAPPSKQETKSAQSAPAVASSAPPAASPPTKRDKACTKDATVTFDEPTLEQAVRRQLSKPSGPIARAELAKVKTLDVIQAPTNDELDPCIFPELTGL